jgi:hypothetical protein
MRKRVRVLILAALVAAVVVPVGFALSLEATRATDDVHTSVVAKTTTALPITFDDQTVTGADWLPDIPDGTALFLAGTILFGLAAALRRSV